MSYITEYTDGEYEIIQYTIGGTVRKIINNEIVGEYTNYWTNDGSIHPKTQKEIDIIEKTLNIKIK